MAIIETANQKAKYYIDRMFELLCKEDDGLRVMIDTMDKDVIRNVKDRLIANLAQGFEVFAKNRPIEPEMETVLMYPWAMWSAKLYLKKPDGVLVPVELKELKANSDHEERKELP